MCDHLPRARSAVGDLYCLRCGQVLGYETPWRPCGCPADPWVFGHLCRK